MSNVNFSFGTNLLGNFIAGNGVYVYATVFAGGTWVQRSSSSTTARSAGR